MIAIGAVVAVCMEGDTYTGASLLYACYWKTGRQMGVLSEMRMVFLLKSKFTEYNASC